MEPSVAIRRTTKIGTTRIISIVSQTIDYFLPMLAAVHTIALDYGR